MKTSRKTRKQRAAAAATATTQQEVRRRAGVGTSQPSESAHVDSPHCSTTSITREEDEGDGSHQVVLQISVDAFFEQLSCDSSTTPQQQQQQPGKKRPPSSFPFFTYTLGKDTYKSESPVQGKLSYLQTHTLTVDESTVKAFTQPFAFMFFYNEPRQQVQGLPVATSSSTLPQTRPPSAHSTVSDERIPLPSDIAAALPTQPLGRSPASKHRKENSPVPVFVDLSPLFAECPATVHFDSICPDPDAPPRTIAMTITVSVAPSSLHPFLSLIQKRKFNPLMLRLTSANMLPLRPCGSFAALDRNYGPVFARYKIPFTSATTWTTTQRRRHTEKVKFDHVKVILAGLLDQDALAEMLETTPLIVELHDREHPLLAPPVTVQPVVLQPKKEEMASTAISSDGQQQQSMPDGQPKLPTVQQLAKRNRRARSATKQQPSLQEEEPKQQQQQQPQDTEHFPPLPKSATTVLANEEASTTSATTTATTPVSARRQSRRNKKRPDSQQQQVAQQQATSTIPVIPMSKDSKRTSSQQQAQQPLPPPPPPPPPPPGFGVARFSLANIVVDGDVDFKIISQIVPNSQDTPGQLPSPPYLECQSELSLAVRLYTAPRINRDAARIARAVFVCSNAIDADKLIELVRSINKSQQTTTTALDALAQPPQSSQPQPPLAMVSTKSLTSPKLAPADMRGGISGFMVTDNSEMWLLVLEGIAEKEMATLDSSIPPEWRQQQSTLVVMSNPRLRFRQALYSSNNGASAEGVLRTIRLPKPFVQLASFTATTQLPAHDVQDTLIQLSTLAHAQRLFEAKILNLFPSVAALSALETHFAN